MILRRISPVGKIPTFISPVIIQNMEDPITDFLSSINQQIVFPASSSMGNNITLRFFLLICMPATWRNKSGDVM